MKWQVTGQQLVTALKEEKSEATIKRLCLKAMQQLFSSGLNLKRPLSTIRKEVEAAFPSVAPTEKQPTSYYWTNSGKGRIARFEHLALWYLTENTERWEIVGDEARKAYWQNLPKFEEEPVSDLASVETEKPAKSNKSNKKKETKTEPKEEVMTIEKVLEMDAEMSEITAKAMEQLGVSLEEFAKRAFKYYAQSVTGKTQKKAEDLAEVPTYELRKGKKYQSHPKRAEELTKRAIRAIKKYNEAQPESADKFAITPSIIHTLIGSKPATINTILATIPDIKGYHFNVFGTEELPYTQNRRTGCEIEDLIKLDELVPDGYTE